VTNRVKINHSAAAKINPGSFGDAGQILASLTRRSRAFATASIAERYVRYRGSVPFKIFKMLCTVVCMPVGTRRESEKCELPFTNAANKPDLMDSHTAVMSSPHSMKLLRYNKHAMAGYTSVVSLVSLN
jgi:hypothetical protein